MELNYTLKQANGSIQVKFSKDSQKELFAELADFLAVFGTHICGRCGSEDTIPVHRVVDSNSYFSKVCQNPNCRAQLVFGQNKKGGTLFAKHKDANGNYDKEFNGWNYYTLKNNDEDEDTDAPQPKIVQKGNGFKPRPK